MFTDKIKCEDFAGNERTEEVNFNLTKSELTQMNLAENGSLGKRLERIVEANDIAHLSKEFQELIDKSYGVPSDDGRYFRKSPEILDDFKMSAAYDVFLMKILGNAEYAVGFVKGIIPKDMASKLSEELAKNEDYQKLINK